MFVENKNPNPKQNRKEENVRQRQSLPIDDFKQQILDTVENNSVTIITAPTGSGKSTQVPQWLIDVGFNVVVTQPRRLAARTVAMRVAWERESELGGEIGFRTAHEHKDSRDTRCLFVTDGLAMVRELMGHGGKHNCLVLDEVHEWNINMEVLVAWAKLQIESGADFKLVIMSATLESDPLSAYYNNAPVINAPGRLFPVREQRAGYSLEDDVVKLLQAGRNVLVFQPGKAEIAETVTTLRDAGVSAVILPLHGELSPEEQAKCFAHYKQAKCVVATNVAQTSITIDDIDAVVDSGYERRIELVNGVEGLYIKPISLSDSQQRQGRAGRCKEGIYIDHCGAANRPEFPTAEIKRSRLDQTVLRLASVGIDATELEFFHQPPKAEIAEAKRALKALGCMNDKNEVTEVGFKVARMPVSVQYGRMIVEAEKLGCVPEVIMVAALLEQGEITMRPKDKYQTPVWWNLVQGETESDIMAQLLVYMQACNMDKEAMIQNGIHVKSFFQAKEKHNHLLRSLRGKVKNFDQRGERQNILQAVCAGMVDHLFENRYGNFVNGDGVHRQLSKYSVVKEAGWLVGKPFDLQIKTRFGHDTLYLVNMATKVSLEMMVRAAPHLTEIRSGQNPHYDPERDVVCSLTQVYFNSQLIAEENEPDPEHERAAEVFARWLAERGRETLVQADHEHLCLVLYENSKLIEKAREWNNRAGAEVLPTYDVPERAEYYLKALGGARNLREIKDPERLKLPKLDKKKIKEIRDDNPNHIKVLGKSQLVEYSTGKPVVCLERDKYDNELWWQQLPDKGIFLPNGRQVTVQVRVNFATITNSDISALKDEIVDQYNYEQWTDWRRKPKPSLPIPDYEELTSVFPREVLKREYGKCVLTGVPLFAYGAVVKMQYAFDYKLEMEWFQSKSDAQEKQRAAQSGFEDLQEARCMNIFESKQRAFALLQKNEYWNQVDGKLRQQLEQLLERDILELDFEEMKNVAREAIELLQKAVEAVKLAEKQANSKPLTGDSFEDALADLKGKFRPQ